MRHILENLINEADAIKRSTTVKRDFAAFNSRLRDVAKELELECQDAEITERLQSLLDYETYDELSKPGKMFRWVLAYEFRLNFIDNWNDRGAYLFDLDWITTKLDALLYRLKTK